MRKERERWLWDFKGSFVFESKKVRERNNKRSLTEKI